MPRHLEYQQQLEHLKVSLDEMEEIILLSEFHLSKGHIEQLIELDNRFHSVLYDACGSKRLIHMLKDFHQYVQKERQQPVCFSLNQIMSVVFLFAHIDENLLAYV